MDECLHFYMFLKKPFCKKRHFQNYELLALFSKHPNFKYYILYLYDDCCCIILYIDYRKGGYIRFVLILQSCIFLDIQCYSGNDF